MATDPAQLKMIVRTYYKALFGELDLRTLTNLIHPEYREHNPGASNNSLGSIAAEDLLKRALHFRATFPNLKYKIEHLLTDGDKVVVHWVLQGTDEGGIMGHPPTGKPFSITGTSIYRVEDDQIIENWTVRDDLGLIKQLGHFS